MSRLDQIGLLVLEKVLYLLNVEIMRVPFSGQTHIHFTSGCFSPHYISNSGQINKNVQTEDGQQEIIKVYLSF